VELCQVEPVFFFWWQNFATILAIGTWFPENKNHEE
jgi:hypothetical protein